MIYCSVLEAIVDKFVLSFSLIRENGAAWFYMLHYNRQQTPTSSLKRFKIELCISSPLPVTCPKPLFASVFRFDYMSHVVIVGIVETIFFAGRIELKNEKNISQRSEHFLMQVEIQNQTHSVS